MVQAGGESRRMGSNKALLLFNGQPLLERVLARLPKTSAEVVITGQVNGHKEYRGVPVIRDLLPRRGALGGLYTALSTARCQLVAVVACDMPFISNLLLLALVARIEQSGADVAIPRTPDGFEPFHAVYRRNECLSAVRWALDAGEQRMISWFDKVRVDTVGYDEIQAIDPDPRIFMNVNTPGEFYNAQLMDQDPSAEPG